MLYYLYIINKAGSLIYYMDLHASQSSRAQPGPDIERIYTYPLPFILKKVDNRVIVAFGESDGVRGIYFSILYQLIGELRAK